MNFNDIAAGWARLWLPRERLPLSQWSERNFYLSPEYSNRTGPVRLFGWQRPIFDAFTDDRVREIDLMCGTQLIKTLLIQAALAYVIAEVPGPTLLVQPKDAAAKKFSKKRLGPMIRDCSVLRDRIKTGRRDKDNTIDYKAFPGGDVSLVGAISPDNLARESIRYLFLDEVDKYPISAGVEGDPIDLAVERLATYGSQAKAILTCSPTVKGRSRIGRAYENSDQRKPWVPCWHCEYRQVLKWARVKWEPNQPETAHYVCEQCGQDWSDVQRWAAADVAEWRAEKPFTGAAGFWISHLYSPWKTLGQIAQKSIQVKDDPERLQAWINTNLAELWEERGEALNYEVLMSRREDTYRLGQVPAGVLFLTAGVDTQKTWLEGYVWGWGRGRQRWLVDHFRVERNPFDPLAWGELSEHLNRVYRHPSGADVAIVRMAVDSGYAGNEVYAFARQNAGRVLAVDGRATGAAIVGMPSQVDVTVGGRHIKHGCKLWPVNVSMAKSELYGLLGKERPTDGEPYPAGWVHTPSDATEEFYRQLTAEQLVTRVVKGYRKTEWIKTRERNEALDCANYARAAASVIGMDRHATDERWWRTMESQLGVNTPLPVRVAQAPPKQESQPFVVDRPSGGAFHPPVENSSRGGWLGDRTQNWFRR